AGRARPGAANPPPIVWWSCAIEGGGGMKAVRQLTIAVGLSLLAASFSAGDEARAQPAEFAIADAWLTTPLSISDCVKQGAAAMGAAGFQVFQTGAEEARASLGNFTAITRCLNGKGIVFFIVIGPSEKNGKFLQTIAAKFSGE